MLFYECNKIFIHEFNLPFSIFCQVQNGVEKKPKNMYFKPITKIIPHTPSSHILFVNCNTNNRSSSPTLDKKFLRLNDWKILMITYQHVLNGLILCAFVCNCFLKMNFWRYQWKDKKDRHRAHIHPWKFHWFQPWHNKGLGFWN